MSLNNNIDYSVPNELIIGRVEPHIYAFSTQTVPNYLKVGDTYRPVETRLNEWKQKFPELKKVLAEIAKADSDTFFRDFSVHHFLEIEKKRKRLKPGTFSDLYYSKEFFENAKVQDVKDAIENIKESHKKNDGKYQFYKFDTSRIPETHTYSRTDNYSPRPNQQQTISNFKKALKKGRKNLLMYAVMRFGKSFTSMCCATEMPAKVVVIVTAKADVKEEWKRTVESHTRFAEYEFLDSDALLQTDKAISKKLKAKKRVAIFLTLQDLQGTKIKNKHKELFQKPIDLLVVDETHFGARASEYGKVLHEEGLSKKEQQSELKQIDNTLDELEDSVKVFNAKVRLHLSGTPYRILMGSEFTNDDIIAFYQFTDIAEDQEKWNKENLNKDDVREWDNPYYGFPQMVRFAFNPNESSRRKMEELKKNGINYAFSALFKPKSISKDNINQNHKKFEHETEVLDLLQVIDGTKIDKDLLGFLNYDRIKDGHMCRHIVCVLPFRASCDALENLIAGNKKKFQNLNSYEIINISGVDDEKNYKDTLAVKQAIKDFEKQNKKTITLTVNRMLTGSTVHEWDTMLYFKDTASPQEYDQAIFRLQNQYIRIGTDTKGDVIKYNMKPQTLLVDFDPNRMFRMQEQKSQIYNVNIDENGNTKLEERLTQELKISPILVLNKNKIVQVNPANILDVVREYSNDKSVVDEATVIPVDFSLLNDPKIKSEIQKLGEIGSKQGLEIKPSEGDGVDFDFPDSDTEVGDGKLSSNNNSSSETEEEDFKGKFATYYAKILFFAFLTDSKVKSLQEIILQIEASKDNKRIANSLDLNKQILTLLHDKINPFILSKLDYKIQNINSLANDKTMKPVDRASNAMKKFSRLSDSEVVTPEKVTDAIASIFPKGAISNSTKILDIAAKQGEFVFATYKKYGKTVAENLFSVPTSKIAYEFTRKVYELLDLNISNIANDYTTYDLIKSDNNILKKGKIKINKTPMKFDIIVGNPPYQLKDGGAKDSAGPIYNKFIEQAKKMNPKYISMIVPARWYNGGKGLDDFRSAMLNDRSMKVLHDFPDTTDCFPGLNIRGGVCYFLRDKEHNGDCEIYNHKGDKVSDPIKRTLLENGQNVFVRYNQAISILRKVQSFKEKPFNEIVSARKPFGLGTNFAGFKNNPNTSHSILLYRFGENGFVSMSQIEKNSELISKWKVLVSKASPGDDSYPHLILSRPIVAGPNSCCTETYILVGPFANKKIANNAAQYMITSFFRFMVLLAKGSQDVTQKTYTFVPEQDLNEEWTDQKLYKKYKITEEEIDFINTLIRPMEQRP